MTLRTGKSGKYRYYTCAGCAQKGASHCPGRSIPMAALDGMVVEQGLMSLDDPALKERLDTAKLARQSAVERARLLERPEGGDSAITRGKIERLATALRQAMHNGDIAFRKAYLRLFVDQITVGDDEIKMRGPTVVLAKAAELGALPPAGEMVPSFVRGGVP